MTCRLLFIMLLLAQPAFGQEGALEVVEAEKTAEVKKRAEVAAIAEAKKSAEAEKAKKAEKAETDKKAAEASASVESGDDRKQMVFDHQKATAHMVELEQRMYHLAEMIREQQPEEA